MQAARFTRWTLAGIPLIVIFAYPADWAIWKLRMARGVGMDTVSVSHVTSAGLKNGRQDIYADEPVATDCSISLFPQAGAGTCWWLRRHSEIVDQY